MVENFLNYVKLNSTFGGNLAARGPHNHPRAKRPYLSGQDPENKTQIRARADLAGGHASKHGSTIKLSEGALEDYWIIPNISSVPFFIPKTAVVQWGRGG